MYGRTDFTWNGINSSQLGLFLVKINISKTKEQFVANRNLVTDRINDKFYLQKIEREPLSFTLELGSETKLTENRIEELAQIFILDKYACLLTHDNNHQYNCLATSSELNVYGNGYSLSLEMTCDSPYSTSPWINSVYNLTETTDIRITNNGSIKSYPIIKLSPLNTGDTIKLTNLTDSGKFFSLGTNGNTPLYKDEVIKVNFENNKLYVDLLKSLGSYRYNNILNGSDFFPLVRGQNILKVSPCSLKIIYRYYYMS